MITGKQQEKLEAYVAFVAKVLCDEYSVAYKASSRPGKGRAGADVVPDVAYLSAKIRVNTLNCSTYEDIFHVVVHECLHVLMTPHYGVWDVVRKLLPKSVRKAMTEAYRQADEQTVVRLTRILAPRLWKEFKKEKK